MDEDENLMQAVDDMDRALEISYATLSLASERRTDELVSWVLVGIMEQVEKIKQCLAVIDEVMTKERGIAKNE